MGKDEDDKLTPAQRRLKRLRAEGAARIARIEANLKKEDCFTKSRKKRIQRKRANDSDPGFVSPSALMTVEECNRYNRVKGRDSDRKMDRQRRDGTIVGNEWKGTKMW